MPGAECFRAGAWCRRTEGGMRLRGAGLAGTPRTQHTLRSQAAKHIAASIFRQCTCSTCGRSWSVPFSTPTLERHRKGYDARKRIVYDVLHRPVNRTIFAWLMLPFGASSRKSARRKSGLQKAKWIADRGCAVQPVSLILTTDADSWMHRIGACIERGVVW